MKGWSKEEEALLFLRYENASWTELKNLLPKRSIRSIKAKARSLKLSREKFSTKGGTYFVYGVCSRHGRILKGNIKWKGKNKDIAYCPRLNCNKKLKVLPKASKLREKYRIEEEEK